MGRTGPRRAAAAATLSERVSARIEAAKYRRFERRACRRADLVITVSTADEAYVRESIVNPAARVVAGYQPVMPTYLGQVSEEQLISLVAYIESLQVPTEATR